ncbi:uncharacterized protein LOC118436989 [Folsomia candida]|uniref:Secreted protein n=1 Tax=Folsomia candida TaxID=158441 RepID=A0A226DUI4_FOLCA|nr:uncharacterized protein LOC118436989 [Folsomia candida]OXA48474.1 hypothetical protein Fcan01_16615 [Folsomia candida]
MAKLLSLLVIIITGSYAVTMPYPAVTLGLGEMATCIGCVHRNNTYAVWDAEEQIHPRGSCLHVDSIFEDPCRITQAIFTRWWECADFFPAEEKTLVPLVMGDMGPLVEWFVCPDGPGN